VGIGVSADVGRRSRFDWLGHIVCGNAGIVVPFFLANHSASASHSVGSSSWWLFVGGFLGIIVGVVVVGGGILGGTGGSIFSLVFGSEGPVFGFFLVLVVISGGVGGGIVGGRAGARIGRR
jgi:hypothetical protein